MRHKYVYSNIYKLLPPPQSSSAPLPAPPSTTSLRLVFDQEHNRFQEQLLSRNAYVSINLQLLALNFTSAFQMDPDVSFS